MSPLVLLHGMLGDPASWDEVRAAARALGTDAPVQTPWLPGHGPAATPVAPSWEDAIDAIAGELKDPSVLVGYSMGARVALGVADRRPDLARGLVLVSAHPGLSDDAARSARRAEDEALAALGESQGIEALAAAHAARPVLADQADLPPPSRARLAARRAAHDAASVASAIRALGLGRMPDLRRVLAAGRCPVAIVAGGRDAKFGALAREMGALAGTAPTIVPGAGHDVVLEAPAAVAAVVARAAARRAS